MDTSKKDIVIWTIVWTLFLVTLTTTVFGLFIAAEQPESNKTKNPNSVRTPPVTFSTPKPEPESLSWYESGEAQPNTTESFEQGPELYRFYISQIHEQYYPDVDPYIALAVLELESNYQPNVKSSAGAVGLMQVIPKWHAQRALKYGLTDIWDPYTNIITGMDLLNELYETTGNWSNALYGYNHSTVYVNNVLARAETLRGGGYFG